MNASKKASMYRYFFSQAQFHLPLQGATFFLAKHLRFLVLLLLGVAQVAHSAAPTLNYTLNPATLTVGQPYTISWTGGSGTEYVSLRCTNGGPDEPELPIKSTIGGNALASWVSAPPSCTISAVNGLGQATGKTFTMTTVAAPANVNDAQFTGQNFSLSMYAGQTYPVAVTMYNSGTTTWSAGEQYRLGIEGSDIWSRGRVELSQNVPPQGSYTFNTTVVAPATAGGHTMQWRMLREGVAWFGASTSITTINVTPPPPANAAEFVSQSIPSRISPGASPTITVTMKNTGTATWTAGQQYRLGIVSSESWSTARVELARDVPPNDTYTFSTRITAPTTAGTYPIQWRMLRENVEWFGAVTPSLSINVAPPDQTVAFQITQSSTGGRLASGATTLSASLSGTAAAKDTYPDTVKKVELWEGSTLLGTTNYSITYEDTVPPTVQNVERSFAMQGNFAVGTHQIYLRFHTHAGYTRDSPLYTVTVLPALVYAAEFVSQGGVPQEMVAGKSATVTVTMKNKGNSAWTTAESYRLGAMNPMDNTTWGFHRVDLSASVEPEQTTTFTFQITAPTVPGTYNLQWQMVRDGYQWFGSKTQNAAIVVKAATQTALSADTTTPLSGRAVTFTATVSGSSPTGNVVFADGATTLATVALNNGAATYTSPALTDGAHTITARYVGSSTNMGSVSTGLGVTWARATTNTVLASSSATPQVGTTVTLTATVSGSNPSGNVTFKDGTATLAPTAISNGVATYVTSKLSGGHAFTASYAGSTTHLSSTSPTVTVTWAKATTTTSLNATATAPFTFTATVAGSDPGGTVKFMKGTTSLGSVVLVNGNASLLALGLPTGTHSVTAEYSGNAANKSSVSPAKSVTVGARTASSYDGAIQRTTYSVVTGDVNGDGQNDVLLKANPGATAPSSPTFALVSSAYGVYSLVVNPAADILNAPVWQPATQQVTYGGPDGLFAGSVTIKAALDTQASFIVAMAADTGNLFIASTTAPVVDPTKPGSSATPLPVNIVPPELNSENAGTLPGALSVSDSGAATYSIPIVVPPGTAGLQPGLSLNYSSHGQNGILGLGWSLSGLSSINRCGKTIAQDGVNERISFTTSDRLCLDGQRLVLVNATLSDANYWSASAEYRTEIESFSRIKTKFVTINGVSARSFEVSSKDGRVMTYGSLADSSVRAIVGTIASGEYGPQPSAKEGPQSWALDTIKDRSGNFIKIAYEQNDTTGEHRPTFIRYGGSGRASHAAIQFSYEERPDAWKRYIDETRNDLRSRIGQIRTYVGSNLDGDVVSSGTVVRSYVLGYGVSPTSGRSLLESIQVSARNPGTNVMESLRPTKFDWGKPDPSKQAGFESKGFWTGAPILTVNNTTTEFGNQAENRAEYFTFNDFNGDGMTDGLEKRVASESMPTLATEPMLVRQRESSNPIAPGTKRASYRYFHNTGNGFAQYSYSLSTGEMFVVLAVGDFDGNGKLDLFVSTDSGTKICLSPIGSSGSPGTPGSTIQFNCQPRLAIDNWGNLVKKRAYVFDPLGDGRSAAYSTIRDSGDAGVATFCNLTGCKLDNNPPRTLGTDPTGVPEHEDMPELTYVDLEQMVDVAGVGKPYDVRWSEAKWVRVYADGVPVEPERWTWANIVPTITVTSLGGPDGASKLGGFANYSYAPVPFPAPTNPGTQGSRGYMFDHAPDMPGMSADFNGSGYNSLVFGFLQLARRDDQSMYLARAETTICLSTGRALDCGVRKKYSGDQYRQVYAVGDFVGDGQAAVMVRPLEAQPFPGRPQAGSAVEMCRVTGEDSTNGTGTSDSNMNCVSWPGMNMPPDNAVAMPTDRAYSMDLLGTGRPQMVVYRSGRYVNGVWVPGKGWEVFAPVDVALDGQALDRIYQVTNGLGANAKVEYADGLTKGLVRTTGKRTLSYPLRSVPSVGKIVSKLKVSTGGGNMLTTSYLYEDPATDSSGRESPGFAVVQSTDEQSGIVTRTERRQDWPYTGMAKTITVTDRNGVVLSSADNVFATESVAQTNGLTTVCPVLKQSTTTRQDPSDPENANFTGYALATITVVNTYNDGWCNVNVQSTTTAGGGLTFGTTTTTKYVNDSVNWLIGLPETIVVSKTDSSVTTASLSRTVKNAYDAKGLLYTQTVEPDDIQFKMVTTYDRTGNSFGLVNGKTVSWQDPATNSAKQRTEKTVYDPNGRFPATVTNALEQSETHAYDAGSGTRISLTGPNGLQTTWTTDGFGRVSVEKRADGNETRVYQKFCTACPSYAVVAIITDSFHGADRITVPQVSYSDSVGHVLRTMSWGFDGRAIVTDMRYDGLGRLSEADHPRFATAAAVLKSRHFYDNMNRPTRVETFDIGNAQLTTRTQYQGLAQTLTNALGKQRVETRDALGQLRKVVQKRKLDGPDVETTFAYDVFGSLTQTIDPNKNVISVIYDKLGRRTDLKDPDLGWIHYDIDPLGQVWRQVSPKQRAASQTTGGKLLSTRFEFDLLGRMTARYETDLESHWVYDQQPGVTCATSRSCGRLVEAYTQAGTVKDYVRQHTYDAFGRPRMTSQVIGDGTSNATFKATIDYDLWSRPVRETYQRKDDPAKVFDIRYNNTGYLARLQRDALVLWQVQEQDAVNRPTQIALGNGLMQSRTYNVNTGWLDNAALTAEAGVLRLQEGYAYDPIGNVNSRTQFWDEGGFTETFIYDELNRLHISNVGAQEQIFTYDDAGNMKSKTGSGASYVYPPQGAAAVRPHALQQIDGGTKYEYDDNGNMTSAPGRSYTWTSFDMPLAMSKGTVSSTFVYGPEHQRTRQTRSDGSVEVYAGAQVTETKAGVVTIKTYWPYGVGVEIDTGSTPTVLNWTHVDRLGSPVAISDQSGVLREKLAYDAWGKRRTTDGTDQTPDTLAGTVDNRGYTGHEMLDDLDLVHMNGRVYDPAIARFITADPILQDPMNGQSYNRYSYVLNNPTNLTDPTGFTGCPASDKECAGGGPEDKPREKEEKEKGKDRCLEKAVMCRQQDGLISVGDGDRAYIYDNTGAAKAKASEIAKGTAKKVKEVQEDIKDTAKSLGDSFYNFVTGRNESGFTKWSEHFEMMRGASGFGKTNPLEMQLFDDYLRTIPDYLRRDPETIAFVFAGFEKFSEGGAKRYLGSAYAHFEKSNISSFGGHLSQKGITALSAMFSGGVRGYSGAQLTTLSQEAGDIMTHGPAVVNRKTYVQVWGYPTHKWVNYEPGWQPPIATQKY